MRPFAFALLPLLLAGTLRAANDYALTDDSRRVMPGAPTGRVERLELPVSRLYPGARHDAWVYVPAQYDPARPHPVMVFQDGGGYQNREGQWRVPTVLDNLIHRKEVPAMVAVFVNPGVVPAPYAEALPRFNRSFEYDSVDDLYARFLVEEVLKEVGKMVKLSSDPNDRAIGGASSGGVCAFNAAFRRPDLFRRVFCTIGTFVGLRGADELSTQVRKVEPLPIRVFLQDGSNDQNIYAGDWWMANQMMQRSLEFAGVDHRYVWGDGGHDGKQGGMVFPEAMRWLWRDYPAPLVPNPEGKSKAPVAGWTVAGEGWRDATEEERTGEAWMDPRASFEIKWGDRRIRDYQGKGYGLRVHEASANSASVHLPHHAETGCCSPDHSQIYVALRGGRHIWSVQAGPGDDVRHAQPYFHLHDDEEGRAQVYSLVVDREGRLYALTDLGVQIFDQAGRVNGILRVPKGFTDGESGLYWGGKERRSLVLAQGSGDRRRVIARTLNVQGQNPSDPPLKPAAPRL